jgi:iron complex transport system substrate-binding protein
VRTAAARAALASIVVGGLLAGCSSSDSGGTTGKTERDPVPGDSEGPGSGRRPHRADTAAPAGDPTLTSLVGGPYLLRLLGRRTAIR